MHFYTFANRNRYSDARVTQDVTPHHMENVVQALFVRFAKDESGATAIEYALIAAGIGIAIITAVNALGTAISDKFDFIKGKL